MCKVNGLTDEGRTFVADVVQDLINAKQMFSKYDVYEAVKDELGDEISNYFKIKKEITSIINHVIDEAWDDDEEYLKDFITREGKTFAVYYPSEADVEMYPEWNNEDHTVDEKSECDENMLEEVYVNTDIQGRVTIEKRYLEDIGVTDSFVAVANYGSEVAIAADENTLIDAPNGVTWLKRVHGKDGLLISMRNRFNDDCKPDRIVMDIDPENKMIHVFLAN